MKLRILALEPYWGGSHRDFLQGWQRSGRHRWTTLTLPAHHWKWRMRHAPLEFCRQLGVMQSAREPDRRLSEPTEMPPGAPGDRKAHSRRWDLLFCSDMLDLATFRGLAPADVASLPAIVYFHENQLTYPTRREDVRDRHFAFTNFTTALAADEVWFNSAFHQQAFFPALRKWLGAMPDCVPSELVESASQRAQTYPPGVDVPLRRRSAPGEMLHIAWVGRWEHDKNPEEFFDTLERLDREGLAFRLTVLGESFRQVPTVFAQAKRRLARHVEHFGFAPTRGEYFDRLSRANVVVSTAHHEFFGLAVLEAVALGLLPLLPKRLAYPEIYRQSAVVDREEAEAFFYGSGSASLFTRLQRLAVDGLEPFRKRAARSMIALARHYAWPKRASVLDDAATRVVQQAIRGAVRFSR